MSAVRIMWPPFVILTLVFAWTTNADAGQRSRQDIRFYKANKILQTDRIWFTKKRASKPGCHNFVKKARVYKAVQFAYAACYLYSKKDCDANHIVEVAREKDEVNSTVLLEGYGWFPQSEHKRGVRVKSWRCTHEAPTTAETTPPKGEE